MDRAFLRPEEILHASVRDGNLDQLKTIAASTPTFIHKQSAWGAPLDVAVECDNADAARLLLEAGANPLNDEGHSDLYRTPLELAAIRGRRAISRLLWDRIGSTFPEGLDDNHTINLIKRCPDQAALYGHVGLVSDYLKWSATSSPFEWKHTGALTTAAGRWEADIVDFLLKIVQYSQTAIDGSLRAAIGFKTFLLGEEMVGIEYNEAEYAKQYRVVNSLINAGADPNQMKQELPLLHHAAGGIVLQGAMKALLERGADPNSRKTKGRTALHLLTGPVTVDGHIQRRFHEAGMRLLLEKGATVTLGDDEGEAPLHWAAMDCEKDIFLLCLSYATNETSALSSTNHHGETLLHYAAAGGKYDTIELLLSRGLNVNAASETSWTPLICTLAPSSRVKPESDAVKCARLLLRSGADTNVVTAEGWTLLHVIGSYRNKTDDAAAEDSYAASLAHELLSGSYELPPIDSPARGSDLLWLSRISNTTRNQLYGDSPWGFRVDRALSCCTETETAVVKHGLTALHWAAERGAVGVARVLVDHGADLTASDSIGSTPLKLAAKSELLRRHEEVKRAVIKVVQAGGY